MNLPAHLVIVKGTEYFDGKSSRYVDYPVTDILQMMGRAGRPQFDTHGIAVVMVAEGKKNFYKQFLYHPFPVESCLKERMSETINAEIAISTIQCLSDAIGYLNWTFFARRIIRNPSFYGAASGSPEDINAFYLKIVKMTLTNLKEHGCIRMNTESSSFEDDPLVFPTILGKAASSFYLQYQTPLQMQAGLQNLGENIIKQINSDETSSSKYSLPIEITSSAVAQLLFVLAHVHEFDELPVRHNEEHLNQTLSERLPWGPDLRKFSNVKKQKKESYQDAIDIFGDPHTKCFLLIQAHITRSELPISDYINDTRTVLDQVPRLLAAMQHICKDDNGSGSFEIFCLFWKVRQMLEAKLMIDETSLHQIPGLSQYGSSSLSREAGIMTLKDLRRIRRADAFKLLRGLVKKSKKKKGSSLLDDALNFVYGIPTIEIEKIVVRTEVDKSSGKNIGQISFELCTERASAMKGQKGSKQQSGTSIAVSLGTPEGRNLLCSKIVTIGKNVGLVRRKIEMNFDWSMANACGGSEGGEMIIRVLHENVMGMDLEKPVPLR